jgi:ABC-type transport system involved in cytochrome c biogenesis ATPase subunit
MMDKLAAVTVTGLFGAKSRHIEFSTDHPITIISGPNGSGKTHLLRLINALAALDLEALAPVYFKSIEFEFRTKKRIKISKIAEKDPVTIFEFSGNDGRGVAYPAFKIEYTDIVRSANLPRFISRLEDGNWVDIRDGEILTSEELRGRYGVELDLIEAKISSENSWVRKVLAPPPAILIDTKRLDTAVARPDPHMRRQHGPAPSRIAQYMEQLKSHISEARRVSFSVTQAADQSFAVRVMEKARTSVKEKELKERYQEIAQRQAELYDSGLNANPVDVKFPEGRTNPTERRVLSVFLDDWERKLTPLLPIHEKLKALRAIIENKLIGKTLRVDARGNVGFVSRPGGRPLQVSLLSSGEQHLLAMFTLLLFSAESGSLVLIDEPEISMHAAWKHAFLDDIAHVADINNLQIVLATHSTSIINGRWELVREMGVE